MNRPQTGSVSRFIGSRVSASYKLLSTAPFAGLTAAMVLLSGIPAMAAPPTTVYAGGAGGVYRSTDGGSTWSNLTSAFTPTALAIDPLNPDVIYAVAPGRRPCTRPPMEAPAGPRRPMVCPAWPSATSSPDRSGQSQYPLSRFRRSSLRQRSLQVHRWRSPMDANEQRPGLHRGHSLRGGARLGPAQPQHAVPGRGHLTPGGQNDEWSRQLVDPGRSDSA